MVSHLLVASHPLAAEMLFPEPAVLLETAAVAAPAAVAGAVSAPAAVAEAAAVPAEAVVAAAVAEAVAFAATVVAVVNGDGAAVAADGWELVLPRRQY